MTSSVAAAEFFKSLAPLTKAGYYGVAAGQDAREVGRPCRISDYEVEVSIAIQGHSPADQRGHGTPARERQLNKGPSRTPSRSDNQQFIRTFK